MKFYGGSPSQAPSGARWGNTVFTNMLIDTDRPRGRPFGGGGVHRESEKLESERKRVKESRYGDFSICFGEIIIL